MNRKIAEIEKFALENIYYDEVSGTLLNINTGHIYYQNNKLIYPQVCLRSGYVCYKMSAHRVAWFLHYGKWPKGFIDHINGNRHDNRIDNLRDINPKDNCKNLMQHREGKTLYVQVKNKKSYNVFVPKTYKHAGGKPRVYTYYCKFQAEMASLMLENDEFIPSIHNNRIVNHFNSKGVLLFKNLMYLEDTHNYRVRCRTKNISKCFHTYDKAVEFLNTLG